MSKRLSGGPFLPMVSLLKRSASGTTNPGYFIRYVTVGAVVVAVDVASFQALLVLGVPLPLTTTIAFVLATLVHFALNKIWTFRVGGLPHTYQLTAYIAVLFASFVITQFVIETSVLLFHVIPVVGKIAALFVQLPVSFLGHRYLTFGSGRKLTR